jgi:hypothetical protein
MHNSIESTDCIQRLRTLLTETLPPYNWQEFQRRARRRTAPARIATDWRSLAAAAALLLFVCAIAVWGRFGGGRHVVVASGAVADGAAAWGRDGGPALGSDGQPRPQAGGGAADSQSRGQVTAAALDQAPANGTAARASDRDLAQGEAVGPTATTVVGQASGESAVANRRSRAIESWLAALPREPAVVRVGTRAAVAGLEDRIAQVDDLMTSMRIEGTSRDRLADLQRERLRLVGSLAQVRYAEVVASASP